MSRRSFTDEQWNRIEAYLPGRVGTPGRSGVDNDQSKRWGSCDARGRIRLNWRLAMAPMPLVDYVIAHEACHILEHNHSRRFWRSLEAIMPDYEDRLRRLDRMGHQFIW
nr:M48 family metallopeptidase [Brucella melitensis]